MAEVITLVSDLTKTPDTPEDPVRPRRVNWEGVWKRVDLTDTEYEGWKKANEPWLAVARDDPEAGTTTRRRGRAREDTDGAAARAWANAHGAELSDRGRCPEDVIKAYKADDPTMIAGRLNGTTAPPATIDHHSTQ